MDSVNSAVNSATSNVAKKAIKITDDITSSIPPPQKVYSLEASNTGYSTPFKVFVVVVILGFLGINILGYASVVMDMFMGIFGEPIKEIGKLFGFSPLIYDTRPLIAFSNTLFPLLRNL